MFLTEYGGYIFRRYGCVLVDVVNIDVLDAVDTNMAGYGGYR